jgi:hypothetical protein
VDNSVAEGTDDTITEVKQEIKKINGAKFECKTKAKKKDR